MAGAGEHIDGLDRGGGVGVGSEDGGVAGEGIGVTGNVDDLFYIVTCNVFYKLR